MSPWNSLLQALHSALIDEVNARWPKVKPELGLPTRHAGLDWSDPHCETRLWCRARLDGKPGVVVLAADDKFSKAAGGLLGFWNGMQKTVVPELKRRGLAPEWEAPVKLGAKDDFPAGSWKPEKLVSIPFRVNGGRLWLVFGA